VTENGIEGNSEEGVFRIDVYTNHIFRVNIGRIEDMEAHSFASIAYPNKDVRYQIDDFSDSINISSENLILQITKNPLRFNFLDPGGEVINCEDSGLGTVFNQEQIGSFRKLQPGERFVGLGEKAGNLDRRGTGLVNWNTDHFGYGPETDPIYSSIPFYIGIHQGIVYGIFLDNSSKSHFNFGASNNRFSSFTTEQGNLNY
jgi:alpha-glucosidase